MKRRASMSFVRRQTGTRSRTRRTRRLGGERRRASRDRSSDGVGVVPQGVARGGRGGDVDGPGELAEDVAVLFGIEPALVFVLLRPPEGFLLLRDARLLGGTSTARSRRVTRRARTVSAWRRRSNSARSWDERGSSSVATAHEGTPRRDAAVARAVGGSGTLTPRGRRRGRWRRRWPCRVWRGARRRFGGETPRDTTVGRSRMLTLRARRRTVPRTPSDTPQPHPSPVCFFRVMCVSPSGRSHPRVPSSNTRNELRPGEIFEE